MLPIIRQRSPGGSRPAGWDASGCSRDGTNWGRSSMKTEWAGERPSDSALTECWEFMRWMRLSTGN